MRQVRSVTGVADATNYGAPAVNDQVRAERRRAPSRGELIGTFVLMWAIMGMAVNPRGDASWAPWVIGATLGFAVMAIGPLTGAGLNPARSFGPALVGDAFGGFGTFLFIYVLGPLVGALLAGIGYRAIVLGPQDRVIDHEGRIVAEPRRRAAGRQAGLSRVGETPVRRLRGDAPPRHLLAQRDAVAVADVRVHCKYCAFATHQPHLHAPDEVAGAARRRGAAQRQGAARPDRRAAGGQHRASRRGWRSCGHEDFVAYVVWCCERALERGLLPHTNLGALAREDLGAAARGDGVAGADARVASTRTSSPTRARRRRTRRCGWRRSAPPASCGSRSRAGSSSASARRPEDRIAALEALAAVHAEHGHLQEVILQNFVPHRRYYGEEPAEIADRGRARSTGGPGSAHQPELPLPDVGDRR